MTYSIRRKIVSYYGFTIIKYTTKIIQKGNINYFSLKVRHFLMPSLLTYCKMVITILFILKHELIFSFTFNCWIQV